MSSSDSFTNLETTNLRKHFVKQEKKNRSVKIFVKPSNEQINKYKNPKAKTFQNTYSYFEAYKSIYHVFVKTNNSLKAVFVSFLCLENHISILSFYKCG